MISKFIDIISPYAYKHLIEFKGMMYTMDKLPLAVKYLNIFHKPVTLLMLCSNLHWVWFALSKEVEELK